MLKSKLKPTTVGIVIIHSIGLSYPFVKADTDNIPAPYSFSCDSASSQLEINECLSERTVSQKKKFQNQIQLYKNHWNPNALEAFMAFEKARNNFVNSHLQNEIDWPTDSSGRSAQISIEEESFYADEISLISRLEQGRFPTLSDNDLIKSDAQLNIIYKKIQNEYEESDPPTGVNKASIKKTQLAWLRYRDAWANFAHLQYPKIGVGTWKAYITDKRITMLNKLLFSD